ncbi:hypothetical protein [Kitasatospora sp. NPDC047058]|uniref:hypothetical protein n=1 Tax=Kitasatospora sp. NPDC047058 TaxID=3155620 RepID=UPI0033CF7576
MNRRGLGGRSALMALLGFVSGIPVGAALLHLLRHPGVIHRPLYLAIFVGAAFAALAAADRVLNHRSTAVPHGGRPGQGRTPTTPKS